MTRLFARASRILIVLSLCANIGLHWATLQSLAWASMIVRYSQSAPLTEALAKTFDGKHPCNLCKAITKSKNAEKKSDMRTPIPKIDLICKMASRLFFPPPSGFDRGVSVARQLARCYQPLVPPPRFA